MRADSTSVWPRLVTELCEGRRGSSTQEGRLGLTWGESRGQQGSGEPKEVASAGPGSNLDCPSFQDSCWLKTRQNRETSEP